MDHASGRFRWIAQQMRGRVASLLGFALAFHVLQVALLAPLTAGMLRVCLERWGRCSIGNFEIVSFLLSVPGVAALVAVGSVTLATVYLELAGLAIVLSQPRPSCWAAFRELVRRFPGLLRLGLRQFAVYLLLAVPFVGATAGAVLLLWRGHDLNGLIVMKPPAFWGGAAVGGAILAVYAVFAARLFLRWILTIPVFLIEQETSARAMRTSVERMRGRLATAAAAVATWAALVFVGTTVVMGLLGWLAARMLTAAGALPAVVVPLTAAALTVHWLVAAVLSVAGVVGFAGLLLAIYRECGGNVALLEDAADAEPPAWRVPHRWTLLAGTLGLLALAAWTCHGLLGEARVEEQIEITAHRGGALLAPENTVAAIRRAAEVGADWAEIDVQLTADGALVVIHDNDLVRVGGSKLRVAESTLAEIRQVDVGRKFSPAFAGERVPTLDEVIAAASEGDGVRLNIELKPHGAADVEPLVAGVLEAIRRGRIVERCHVCSQSYESLQLAKQREPGLKIGFIAGAALGDLSKLDVDFLMVDTRLATRELVERAGLRDIAIHAWTVNDPDKLLPLVDRGVANAIGDDPVALRRRLDEIRELTPAERLLLRARNAWAD